jgi:hypothetical protein
MIESGEGNWVIGTIQKTQQRKGRYKALILGPNMKRRWRKSQG